MRYVNLSSILAYTKITSKIRKLFPTYASFVGAKLLLPHEVGIDKKIAQEIKKQYLNNTSIFSTPFLLYPNNR